MAGHPAEDPDLGALAVLSAEGFPTSEVGSAVSEVSSLTPLPTGVRPRREKGAEGAGSASPREGTGLRGGVCTVAGGAWLSAGPATSRSHMGGCVQRVLGSTETSSSPSAKWKLLSSAMGSEMLSLPDWARQASEGQVTRQLFQVSRNILEKPGFPGSSGQPFRMLKKCFAQLGPRASVPGNNDSLVVRDVPTRGRCLRRPVPLGRQEQGPAVWQSRCLREPSGQAGRAVGGVLSVLKGRAHTPHTVTQGSNDMLL